MNQWDYLNQRADELERALNAGRGNVKSLYDPKKPTPYQIQQQNAGNHAEKSRRASARNQKGAKLFSLEPRRWSSYLSSHHNIWNTTSDTLSTVIKMQIIVIVVASQSCLRLGFLFWFTVLPPLSLVAHYPLQQHCANPDCR